MSRYNGRASTGLAPRYGSDVASGAHAPAELDRESLGSAAEPQARGQRADASAPSLEAPVLEELLVEDVSIDGMCGVY
jgi:mycofactocin precursor